MITKPVENLLFQIHYELKKHHLYNSTPFCWRELHRADVQQKGSQHFRPGQ